jgi:hypothetical protein
MAVALGWKDHVDTDLQFSEFFDQSHTLLMRFMPQFPNGYEGPCVAENGTGTFGVGQGQGEGDVPAGGVWQTFLYLAVGTQFVKYPAVLTAGTWYHLAVVANVTAPLRTFTVFLDGVGVGPALQVTAAETNMPTGTLRFGKRTTSKTVNGHNAQYYGLLDDIAICSRALSAAEIQNIRSNVPHLTGNESDLLAGYTFDQQPGLPLALTRPVSLHGAAARVNTSAGRDSANDAALLPLPAWHQPMDLPFAPGAVWKVTMGVNTSGFHHDGIAAFCWDFVVADQASDGGIESFGEYPNGTGGAPLYASAPGTVITVRENQPDGTGSPPTNGPTPNILEIEQAAEEIVFYEHLRKNSVPVSVNDLVAAHQKIGLAGASGMGSCNNCNHLHFAVTDKPDGTPGFVTLPIAFRNYEVRDAPHTWRTVSRGMPQSGEVIRRPPSLGPVPIPVPSDGFVFRRPPLLIKRLMWSWVIVLGGLMITPGGVDCIACGPNLTVLLGIVTIALGAWGLVSRE